MILSAQVFLKKKGATPKHNSNPKQSIIPSNLLCDILLQLYVNVDKFLLIYLLDLFIFIFSIYI